MPRWSVHDYQAYISRRMLKDHRTGTRAEPQPAVRDEPLGTKATPRSNSPRYRIVVVSYRRRLCDIDNLAGKFHVDGLRYAGVIPDDNPAIVTEYAVQQVKVATRGEERTEITLERKP